MTRTLVWRGLDAPRMEIAHARLEDGRLWATGTQIGVSYELGYELEPGKLRAEIMGGPSVELGLGGADFFDVAFSPLFNSLPVLAGLAGPREFVMSFVDVPSLEATPSGQRYEPVGDGRVRFTSGSFSADIEFDADGFVLQYQGLAERVG